MVPCNINFHNFIEYVRRGAPGHGLLLLLMFAEIIRAAFYQIADTGNLELSRVVLFFPFPFLHTYVRNFLFFVRLFICFVLSSLAYDDIVVY